MDIKPYYLDRERVRSRLFGEIQSSQTTNVDWKNLEKMSKEAIKNADLPMPRLVSLLKVLINEITRLKKLDEFLDKELSKKLSKDKKEEQEREKTTKRKIIGIQRSKKLKIVQDEVERLIKIKEEEKKAPKGIIVDPKKQIFISRHSIDQGNKAIGTKNGSDEPIKTEAHIKHLRKKDYYENRVKKVFQ